MFAATMLVPLAFAVASDDGAQRSFDIALLVTTAMRPAMTLSTRRFRRDLQARDGFLFVTLVWTVLPAFATLPLLLQLPDLIDHRRLFRNDVGPYGHWWPPCFPGSISCPCRSTSGAT